MLAPKTGTIQSRVLQALIKHFGEPITLDVILAETNRDGGRSLDEWKVKQALTALRIRGYEIEMDPLPSKTTKSTNGRTYRLLRHERVPPPIEVVDQTWWEVVVKFGDSREARQFAKALRTVTNREVEVR